MNGGAEAPVDDMHYDYLIVGAGLFGAVFAHEMKENDKKCLVIDRRDHIAGNIYTKNIAGIDVHMYGAHIFHTGNERVWRYINRFTEFNNFVNSPIALYHDELYNLPFNMNTFSKLWNVKTPDEAKAKIKEQIVPAKSADGQAANLEEHVLSMVGRDVYEKLIKGYTEKQWGRDCKDLPADIIKRLPLRFVYDNNYFNDRYQGIPVDGYTSIVEKLLEGVEVRTGVDYKQMSGSGDTWDKLLYTGAIDEYFDFKLGHLEYRTLGFEHEVLENVTDYQGNAVVNFTEREIPYTRIIEHKHFSKVGGRDLGPDTVITREYPMEWKVGDEPYYPINDEKNNSLYARYRQMAEQCDNVLFGGRLGAYRYYDMDKIIEAALDMAEDLK